MEIRWRMLQNPQRLKQIELIKKFLGYAFYATGIVYLIIIYGQYQQTGSYKTVLTYALTGLYLLEIILWQKVISKKIKYVEREYFMDEQGLRIVKLRQNDRVQYAWSDFRGFAEQKMINFSQNKTHSAASRDTKFFLFRKGNQQNAVGVDVDQSNVDLVRQMLGKKLK